ncbi:MAG: ABC transporter permease [Nitrososphaerota archaeon]|nr:ABC transporter permease [Nitrososphaerota archaeon]MDG6966280.1 ABC transporter permease [Nitrososphaerota archaeon]MDG6977715.1 ABC transporter permease [Nitrososphaerota archaeon]MDG7022002.1 ABC transporter permease [Nitrososphaerota archaeon]
MKLYEYAIRRILLMGLVLLGLSLLMFYLTRGFLPPSFALAPYITPRMNSAEKLALAQSLGVATQSCPSFQAFSSYQPSCLVPVYEQYAGWLGNVLKGDWGLTLLPGIAGTQTTLSVFFSRFPFTAELAIMGAILTILIGIPLGIVSATHNNKLPDHLSRIVSLGGYSIPQFWFGYVLLIIFVLYVRVGGLGLLPGSGALATTCAICFRHPGTVSAATGAPILDGLLAGNLRYAWDSLVAMILPAITLSITSIGALTRIVRSSMLEVLRQDYMLLARSKGLTDRVVIYRQALRNALLPAVTVAGLLTAFLFGGVVVIEIVFDLPGVGYTSLQAVNVFDINFIELYVLVTALIIVVTNLAVDIIYAKLDPRIRY